MTGEPDFQPTLIGDTVILQPTVEEDWAEMFALASDPLIWELHPAHDRWQEGVFAKFFDDALASGGGLTIRDKASGAIIGASRYSTRWAGEGEVEIGWTFLSRAYWGGATNREVKALMLAHAHRWFATCLFMVGKDNLRSRRAMEKIGGVLRDDTRIHDMDGVPVTHVMYAIHRPAT
ncbi:MAG: GNAT family N-acetyltransferase [Sphingopyxis sp.]